ncbi:MAG: PAS domain S-box protein [Acidobacteria bacterium]|nr:PAS domain S-box protein [Acidobacteriota bacterium]
MKKYDLKENVDRSLYLEELLKYKELQLKILNDMNIAVINSLSIEEVIVLTINQLYEYFSNFYVLYSVINGNKLKVIYSLSPRGMASIKGLSLDLTTLPRYLTALSSNGFVLINDLSRSSLLINLPSNSMFQGVKAILDVATEPIKGLIGVISFYSLSERDWNEQEFNLLRNIANSLKAAIKGLYAQEEKKVYNMEMEKNFSSYSSMVCIAGKDGYFKRLSPAFEKVLGYSLSELCSIPYIDFVHPDDRENSLSVAEKARRGELVTYFENRFRSKDGSYKWLAWSSFSVSLKDSSTLGYAIAQDITEKKNLYNELESLSLVASKTDNAVLIVDRNGYVEWVNEGFTRLTGYIQKEVLGKTPEEILQGPKSEVKTGIKTTAIRKPFNEKIQGYGKDGQPYWVSTSITPIFDKGGDIDRFIIIETNITKQHLVENRVLENEVRLSSIINSAMDAIITFDSSQNILVFNSSAERIFLCPAKNAIGQQIDKFIPILNKYKLLDKFPPTLSDTVGLRSNKENFSIEATMSEVTLAKEKLYTIILRDITDRQLSEARLKEYAANLEKINKELDQFAYVVSHDLKAPLRGISHLTEWLEEDLAPLLTPDTQHKMGLIRNRVNRMEALINSILKYSRIGRTQVIEESVDVKILINEVIESLEPLPNFSFEIKGEMPILFTQRITLSQVFSNLISNAIKYHHKNKGIIEIGVREEENYEFYVKDDGPGIDLRYHKKIFEIFQTLEAKSNVESTGIGLAIVKKIVETQGGCVWLESEVGQGTTFYFTWIDNSKKKKHSNSRFGKNEFLKSR